jgi:hypothetical protein
MMSGCDGHYVERVGDRFEVHQPDGVLVITCGSRPEADRVATRLEA